MLMVHVRTPLRRNLIDEYISATHIIRAAINSHSIAVVESASAPSIMHVANRMIVSPIASTQNRTKACFILSPFNFSINV